MKFLILLILSILGGTAYRTGGTSLGTKWRDLGVPVIATISLLVLGIKSLVWGYFGLILALFLHFGLLFGSLTTYWKKENEDAKWYNWLFTGLGYSLAAIPIAWITGSWIGLLLRTACLTITITLWSQFIGWDILEEGGKGFAIIVSLPLLFLIG